MPRKTIQERAFSRYRNNVRECRLRALVATQEELARRTGIPRSTISALEANRLFLSSAYALLIAEAIACRLDDLYDHRNPAADAPEENEIRSI
jgi:DNA-binding XRE family transcriptional regulator